MTSYRLREQCCPVQSWVARLLLGAGDDHEALHPLRAGHQLLLDDGDGRGGRPATPGGRPGVMRDGRSAVQRRRGRQRPRGGSGSSESQKRPSDPYKPEGYRQYAPPAGIAPKSGLPALDAARHVRPGPARGAARRRSSRCAPANVEGEIVRGDKTAGRWGPLDIQAGRPRGRDAHRHRRRQRPIQGDPGQRRLVDLLHRADGQLLQLSRVDVSPAGTSQLKLTSR